MRTILTIGCLLCLLTGCDQPTASAASGSGPRPTSDFRSALATRDAATVAQWIVLPLPRPFPLPPIRDPQDLAARFGEVFPEELVSAVADSRPEDWEQVGWRGVMFDHGKLWLRDSGELFACNAHGEREQQHRARVVAADRAGLHPSLRNHEEPVLCWQTEDFRVRVDRMRNGSLRYASWRRAASKDAQPDLVLHGGDREIQGTARNESLTWTNGDYVYACRITHVGPDDAPPFELAAWRGEQQLVAQAAEMLYPE
jgi:hypothetical protein